jgi:hypothetical protein
MTLPSSLCEWNIPPTSETDVYGLILAFLLIAAPAAAQYQIQATPTPAPFQIAQGYNVGFNPRAGGTPTPTPTPTPDPRILLAMDFELADCADSGGEFTCTYDNDFDPNCASPTSECPLNGEKSGWTTNIGGSTNWATSNPTDMDETTKVTVDFRWTGTDDDDDTSVTLAFRLKNLGGDSIAAFGVRENAGANSNTVYLQAGVSDIHGPAICGGSWNWVEDVEYNIRIDYDGAGVSAKLWVDTGDDWGKGVECTLTRDSDDEGEDMYAWTITDYQGNNAMVFDDIGVCDATAGFYDEDEKCGN